MKINKNIFILISIIVVNILFLRLFVSYIKSHINAPITSEQKIQHKSLKSDNKIKSLLSDFINQKESSPINNTDLNQININQDSTLFIPSDIPLKSEYLITKTMSSNHKGVDFAARKGDNIYTPAFGIISLVGKDKYFGNFIKINHLNGYNTFYAHLDTILVSQSMFVKKNQIIGKVGNSGFSDSPHLHYEIIYNSIHINPFDLISIENQNENEYEKK